MKTKTIKWFWNALPNNNIHQPLRCHTNPAKWRPAHILQNPPHFRPQTRGIEKMIPRWLRSGDITHPYSWTAWFEAFRQASQSDDLIKKVKIWTLTAFNQLQQDAVITWDCGWIQAVNDLAEFHRGQLFVCLVNNGQDHDGVKGWVDGSTFSVVQKRMTLPRPPCNRYLAQTFLDRMIMHFIILTITHLAHTYPQWFTN